jgi:hypothetical protein
MKANRSLLAFLLAGLTAGILFTCFNCLSSAVLGSEGIVVTTTQDPYVDEAVAAINGLHLPGVHAEKISHLNWSPENVAWTLLSFTLLFLIITGFVLFFYKLYCRWLCTTHCV